MLYLISEKSSSIKEKDVSFAAEIQLKGNILRCNSLLRLLSELKEHAEITEMMVGTISKQLASPCLTLDQSTTVLFFAGTLCEIFVELLTGKNKDFKWNRRERDEVKKLSRFQSTKTPMSRTFCYICKVRTFHLRWFRVGFHMDSVVSFSLLVMMNICFEALFCISANDA